MARQRKSSNVNGEDFPQWKVQQAAKKLTDEAHVFMELTEDGIQPLSPQQWQAIQFLVAGKRQVEVSKELNVTQETVSRWRSSPLFAAALNIALRDSYQATIGELREAKTDAIRVLRDLLDNRQPRIRLSAAQAILRLHLQLDAHVQNLPTTPAAVATNQLHVQAMQEMGSMFDFSFG